MSFAAGLRADNGGLKNGGVHLAVDVLRRELAPYHAKRSKAGKGCGGFEFGRRGGNHGVDDGWHLWKMGCRRWHFGNMFVHNTVIKG